ncbi:hypothetical protein K7X08_008928 [Anisodus acutangulus]|uniref:Uncharacterized protein n=1 Tax=Anisodus acutangulus TaxID=402998 RepID=A0A9Q1MYC8_9SOLA|nr:hypothetical protein K7X08_008928 [Anisodus acutangulus]
MATSAWDITATEFLQGFHRQKLALPRHSGRQTNRLLWGTLPRQSPVCATAELLKLVQTKISNQIIGLKTEQCFNIGLTSDISSDKLSVLKWVLGETYEPESLGSESSLDGEKRKILMHISLRLVHGYLSLQREAHNFPCAMAPYPGAETGAGGRIRDTHATGRGFIIVASTAGYCVGNLNLEESYAPWEDPSFTYPANLASPLQILIDASNGASDYGNKFGKPLIQGYTRNFGMRLVLLLGK